MMKELIRHGKISVPNFNQTENSKDFLEYVISVLDEYLNE